MNGTTYLDYNHIKADQNIVSEVILIIQKI